MAATNTITFSGSGILPCMRPEEAATDAVVLAPGSYPKGTVIGQMTGLADVADVQTITVSGTPTGGSFRLSFMGQTTAAIAYNAAAAAVQAALEALTTIGTGGVVCSGGAFPGTPVVVTFAGDLVNRWQPLVTLYSNSLTGGSSPTATIAHTTPGGAAGGMWRAYDDAQSDGTNIARAIVELDTEVSSFGNHTSGGGEWAAGSYQKSAPAWIAGYFKTNELTGLDANGVGDLGKIVYGAVGSLSNAATVLRIY